VLLLFSPLGAQLNLPPSGGSCGAAKNYSFEIFLVPQAKEAFFALSH
jgi:hypothetical protein